MQIFIEGLEFEKNPIYIIRDIENNIEKECRICLDSCEEEDNKLLNICECKGSIKYIHKECVMKWIKERNGNTRCELCKTKYDKEKLKINPIEKFKILLFYKERLSLILGIILLVSIILIIIIKQ
jgi:E3 ubiquitin-protein ligase DOA10